MYLIIVSSIHKVIQKLKMRGILIHSNQYNTSRKSVYVL